MNKQSTMNRETLIIGIVAIIAIIVAVAAIFIAYTGFFPSTGGIPQRGDQNGDKDNGNQSDGNGGILPSPPANIILKDYGHEETFRIIGGFVSQVTFTVTNKGMGEAEEIRIHPIVYDDNGNVQYDFETSVASNLRPEESTTHTIRVNYQFLTDDRLHMDITVMWKDGQNAYEESYEPQLFSRIFDRG